MTRRLAALLIVAVGTLAGCGADELEDVLADSGEATVPTVAGTTTPSTPTATGDECATERTTLEVAIEAYYAMNTAFPASQADLVGSGLLRTEIDTYDLAADGELVRVAAVPCPTGDPEGTTTGVTVNAGRSTDDVYASFTDDDIELFGGPECARELAVIVAAAERFIAREGRDVESLADLTGDLDAPVTSWVFDVGDQDLHPAPGSPCPDFVGDLADDACTTQYRTIQTAVEAYVAQYGSPPPSITELVGEYLREAPAGFEIVDGEVVVAAGGQCEAIVAELIASEGEPVTAASPEECAVTVRTLETAIEAFVADTGRPPIDQQELLGDYLRVTFADFEIADGVVVALPDSICAG